MPSNRDYVMNRQGHRSRMSGEYAMNDGRNPRGNRGNYMANRKPQRYNRDYNMPYDSHMPYGFYGMGGMYPQPPMDYTYDYGSYDMSKEAEKEYCEDLEEWIEKLEPKDKFRLGKDQVIEKARTMGVQFKDYDELEFYAAYLAMVSDFKSLHNILKDPAYYIHMAKDFLEDDDVKAKGGEKICKYLDNIVM